MVIEVDCVLDDDDDGTTEMGHYGPLIIARVAWEMPMQLVI